jgi:UDPglucose--hexose-1-phosphate uridylyltransferase
MNEIRKHYFLDEYVIYAPGRFKRPHDYEVIERTKRIRRCHFCRETRSRQPRQFIETVENHGKYWWEVAVVPNSYPAVSLRNLKAYGKQEIVIETPEHLKDFSDLSEKHIEKILGIYQRRVEKLIALPKIKYILIFKNDGPAAGASLSHSHSQIYALPFVSAEFRRELEKLCVHQKKHCLRCAYCKIIEKEKKENKRVIFEDKYTISFTPNISKYKLETWIFTKRHTRNILDLTKEEKESFARQLKKIISHLDRNNFSYNFFSHSVKNFDLHFYIKIQPRISTWGGVEMASESDIVVNSVTPERARNFYLGRWKPF